MLKLVWIFLLLLSFKLVTCLSVLCGRTKSLELNGGSNTGSALALALVRPRSIDDTPVVCRLKVTAPNAAAFTVRLIDVKETLFDFDRQIQPELQVGTPMMNGIAGSSNGSNRKWSSRSASQNQDTAADQPPVIINKTDTCTLSIFIGESRNPVWKLNLCGGNAASITTRAGVKLLPSRLKVVWVPPTSPYHHTEKLRLVITAVNSGAVCNDPSQYTCAHTGGLCISNTLVCDGVWHCPAGDDEDSSACAERKDPPLLEFLRILTARNQEILGLDQPDLATKPSVIMKIGETEQKQNAFQEFGAALKPYGPWGYLVVGMLICACVLMFCLAWECCCRTTKPSQQTISIPPSCLDPSPTVLISATAASAQTSLQPATPPAYEPPPTYSSLFPRAFKSSPTPISHVTHQEPPD